MEASDFFLQMAECNQDAIDVVVKWSGKEYPIEKLPPSNTVLQLKQEISKKTGVLPERQKLLGLKYKGKDP